MPNRSIDYILDASFFSGISQALGASVRVYGLARETMERNENATVKRCHRFVNVSWLFGQMIVLHLQTISFWMHQEL
jgi:hypothetical protein